MHVGKYFFYDFQIKLNLADLKQALAELKDGKQSDGLME